MIEFIPDFHPCVVKESPWTLQSAAALAWTQNPANVPYAALLPDRLTALITKYWGPKGVKLGVKFLDVASTDRNGPELKRRVLAHMNAWGEVGANVVFVESLSGSAEVRITRQPGGHWSYLGTDILSVPANEPTMNLEGFRYNTTEGEYKRVVRHETGHTLGFPHEHMRREIVSRLDEAKTIEYFRRTQGWSANEVRQQVLTPLEQASILGTPADADSIMCYHLPASITVDGQPILGGKDINGSDAEFCARLYPRADAPTPPPASGKVARVVLYDAQGGVVSEYKVA